MEKLTKEQIEVAVNWWADAIKNPKFDNGDNSQTGGMSMMLATMAHVEVPEAQIEAFKVALTAEIESSNPRGLDSDYGPDMTLANAMQTAGINVSNSSVPWKTNMNFRDGGVQVSHGYGAEYVTLHPTA